MTAARRWYRPELALVLGIPLLTIVAGLTTLWIASGDLSADGEHEGARRTAQMQTADFDPDLAAARAGLSGSLRVDRVAGRVQVSLPRSVPAGTEVEVEFVHSLHAGRDLRGRLRASEGAWVATLAPDAGSRWRVVVADRAHSWRLVGTLPRGSASLLLQPALAAP